MYPVARASPTIAARITTSERRSGVRVANISGQFLVCGAAGSVRSVMGCIVGRQALGALPASDLEPTGRSPPTVRRRTSTLASAG